MSDINRRELLGALAGAGAASLLSGAQAAEGERKPNLIRTENEREGTTDWQLTYTRVDPKTKHRSPSIEGYASRQSVRAGDKIDFFVSTNPATPFVIDLYRVGYYA